jgi:hypothetical protein
MQRTATPTAPPAAMLQGQLMLQPPDQVARLGVWGLLEEDARVFSEHGHTYLQVLVAQHLKDHPQALHIQATYVYPDTGTPAATEIAARARAQQLHTRTEVVVTGEALVPGHHRGRPVHVLKHVVSIRLAAEAIGAQHAGAPSTTTPTHHHEG